MGALTEFATQGLLKQTTVQPVRLKAATFRRAAAKEAYELRLASTRDAPAIARLFKTTYEKSSHPCSDSDHVRDLLVSGRIRMIVAEYAGEVIGCFAAIVTNVPGVVDMGYLVLHKAHRQLGLSSQLNDAVMAAALDMPECDIIISFLRSTITYHLAKTNADLSRVPFGHDGGMNVANDIREYHVLAYGLNPNRIIRRASPTQRLPVVEKRIANLPAVLAVAARPHAWCVMPPEDMPSNTVEGPCACLPIPEPELTLDAALGRIDSALRTGAHIEHRFAYVPVEQKAFLRGLYDRGFRATAYMPAWHKEDGVRHDCVLMVKYTGNLEPRTYGLGRCVAMWDRQLADIGRD